jgi:gamma-D-glutamyl-L-lysine dipeptidyl-peptidase
MREIRVVITPGPATARGSKHRRLAARSAIVAAAATALLLAACGSGTATAAGRTAKAIGSRTPATAATASSTAPAGAARAPAACVAGTCWVDVSVATAWVKPWYPRGVDKPALGNPARPGAWVRDMSLAQKRWLVGRLETQATYGTKVIVTGHWRNWTHVAIPSQPTNRDSRGYPGWIPTVQLTRTAPPGAAMFAMIRSATAWLWSSWNGAGVAGSRVMLASYGTSLPVVAATTTYVKVRVIGGRAVAVRRGDVALLAKGAPGGATRAQVVAEARKFLGLPYLWAGVSGFGFDCSGFTYSVYRAFGLALSRDADQQAVHGKPVTRSALRPGDLVFFRESASGPIGHVGMYVGSGMMIDAPNTTARIRIEPVASFAYYAGARRYLSREQIRVLS